jgi:hypothetical protein
MGGFCLAVSDRDFFENPISTAGRLGSHFAETG